LFDGTNYQVWKLKALARMKGQGWYKAVFGTTATLTSASTTSALSTLTLAPSTGSSSTGTASKAAVSEENEIKETKELYETYKARAYSFLINSLSNEVLSLFTSVKQDDPAELWNAIQKHYESDTVTSK